MAVGKTSIIQRIILNRFDEQIEHGGLGEGFFIYFEEDIFSIFFEDFWGQEKTRCLVCCRYPHADGIILVYDITNRRSFEECENYYDIKIKDLCQKNIKKILLGNKSDLEDERVIKTEEGLNFAEKYGYKFGEISCKYDENVFKAFEEFIIEVINNKKKNGDFIDKQNNYLKLKTSEPKYKKKKSQCQ